MKPDLTTLGKIIGGGMPVGAFGGRQEIMDQIAPLGPVYQAGTLSGNPVAMAAGLATLKLISAPGFYAELTAKTQTLIKGVREAGNGAGVALTSNQIGGMFGLFFTDKVSVNNFSEVMDCDVDRFNQFFHGMLEKGIYLAPSAFEAGFVSAAHSEQDIEKTIQAASEVFKTLSE